MEVPKTAKITKKKQKAGNADKEQQQIIK